MKDYNKELLIGTWRNEDLEYTFANNSVSFHFLKSQDLYKGFYELSYNNLRLTYTRNESDSYLHWEAVIEKLDSKSLVFIDISNEIGRREIFRKKEEIKNSNVSDYSKTETRLSILAFVIILLFFISILTDKYIFGDKTLELIIGFAFFPAIVYIRNAYKKIDWVKKALDDLLKLIKDIVRNDTVQAIFLISIILIFLEQL